MPFFLGPKAFLSYGFLSLLTAGMLYGWSSSGALFLAQVTQQTLLDTINPQRSLQELPMLQVDPRLQQAAQAKAEDMAEKGYFAHTSPSGESPWVWFDRAGYEYAAAGENLALNFSDADSLVQAWLDSPPHAKVLQNGYFQDIGIGIAEGEIEGKPALVVVALFGKEISLASAEPLPEAIGMNAEEIQSVKEIPVAQEVPGDSGDEAEPEDVVLREKVQEEGTQEREYVLAANESLIQNPFNHEIAPPDATLTAVSEGSRLALSGIFLVFSGWTVLYMRREQQKIKFLIPRVASFLVFALLLWGGEFF